MKPKISTVILVLTALAFSVAACGDDDEAEPQGLTGNTTTNSGASGASGESGSKDSGGGAIPAEEGEVRTVPEGRDVFFRSPSKNIGCVIAAKYVRCDVGERDWDPGKRPMDCPGFTDYGQGIELDAGKRAAFVCAGDTTLGIGRTLPYGSRIESAEIGCDSSEDGVTCADSDGNGFFISRQSFELQPVS